MMAAVRLLDRGGTQLPAVLAQRLDAAVDHAAGADGGQRAAVADGDERAAALVDESYELPHALGVSEAGLVEEDGRLWVDRQVAALDSGGQRVDRVDPPGEGG